MSQLRLQTTPFGINWKDGSSRYQPRREDATHWLVSIPRLGCPRRGWYSQTVGGPRGTLPGSTVA